MLNKEREQTKAKQKIPYSFRIEPKIVLPISASFRR